MMREAMSNLRKCPRCGSAHPAGVTLCPRDSSRPVAPSPYDDDDDDVTFKRKPGAAPVVARPLVQGALGAYADEEEEWEKSVSRDVMVGKQIGDYLVKRRIGAGGMGIVYEGEHPVIGRKVAIKILRPDFAEGGRARDLASEARAAAAIRHRGIIDIFGFGNIPGVGQYLVMEYLDGAPLDEVIHQRSPMLEVEVVTVLDELLSALAAAHAAGVIHRDLKPGNVFVVRDGAGNEYVKVLDFGLAKRSVAPNGTTPQTRTSMMVGTPEYMAPEQACGQEVGPHTDLYAVGVIAFEMLTRRLPFEGESPMAIAVHHVRTPPPSPATYVDLHPEVEALVMRLLAKTPEERPASADAVRRELKVIAKKLASDATQLSPPPRVSAPSTVSQEAVAVAAPPPARVRTERYGQQPARRTRPPSGGKGTPVPSPRRATPPPVVVSASPTEVLRVDPTAKDLTALPSGRSRAMWVGVSALVGLALVAGGGWLLRDGDASTPKPLPLEEGAVAAKVPLREMPASGTPVALAPIKPVRAPVEAPPAAVAPEASPAQAGSGAGTPAGGEVRAAGGQKPLLAATVLAKDTQAVGTADAEGARASRKPVRPVATSRDGRKVGTRTGTARDEASEEAAPAAGMGSLSLKVRGNVTDVIVDGVSYGKTFNLELPAGIHKLQVRGNDDMQPYSIAVTILSGETTERHVLLEKL